MTNDDDEDVDDDDDGDDIDAEDSDDSAAAAVEAFTKPPRVTITATDNSDVRTILIQLAPPRSIYYYSE